MLIDEAKWIGKAMRDITINNISPLLNIGSSTREFRVNTQPWIEQYIFSQVKESDLIVIHTDIKEAEGVDIVGDLRDEKFLEKLKKHKFKTVICSNLLEHIKNKEEIISILEDIIPIGGYIIVTVPYKYPYHADPIDTMYRPCPEELALLFKQVRIVKSEIVCCGTHFHRLIKNPLLIVKTFFRFISLLIKPHDFWLYLIYQTWIFRTFKVTCLVLKKY